MKENKRHKDFLSTNKKQAGISQLILFDKKINDYRIENESVVFEIFCNLAERL